MSFKPISICLPMRKLSSTSVELWMQRRVSQDELNGLLEFPGGKLEPGENAVQACLRELREETGYEANLSDLRFINSYQTNVSGKNILIFAYLLNVFDDEFQTQGEWIEIDFNLGLSAIDSLIPSINHKIIGDVLSYFKQQTEVEVVELLWPQ